jgi:hypothetical protein
MVKKTKVELIKAYNINITFKPGCGESFYFIDKDKRDKFLDEICDRDKKIVKVANLIIFTDFISYIKTFEIDYEKESFNKEVERGYFILVD